MAGHCICGSEDYTDHSTDTKWIACDMPGCPVEWFHIECVGLTDATVPEDDWFCDQCKQNMQHAPAQRGGSKGDRKRKQRKPPTNKTDAQVYLCEVCDERFTDKESCLEHKSRHLPMYNQPLQEKSPQSDDKNKSTDPEVPAKISRRSSSFDSRSDISQRSVSSLQSVRTDTSAVRSDTSSDRGGSILSEEKRQFLKQFTDEEILAELERREEAMVCVCGIVFEDQSLYYLHKGCHNTNNPKKCSFCSYEAKDYYDFTSHFFQHKNTSQALAS